LFKVFAKLGNFYFSALTHCVYPRCVRPLSDARAKGFSGYGVGTKREREKRNVLLAAVKSHNEEKEFDEVKEKN
jgi:hypothetical protein